MSTASKIEWTGATWNPVVGCTIHSPGCANCYAMREAYRKQFHPNAKIRAKFAGTVEKSKAGQLLWTGRLNLSEDALLAPLRRKTPTTWFVNSMSDLFHEGLSDEAIDRVFAVMALCPQHTFQVLTKRSDRMRECGDRRNANGHHPAIDLAAIMACTGTWNTPAIDLRVWPLPNVWLGVSVEDQQRADERIPDLLATPAAVRFLSCEPLLGPVDLTAIRMQTNDTLGFDAVAGSEIHKDDEDRRTDGERVDWVIAGGESGPKARPMHPDWARSLRDQCAAAGVPFFFKQWGEWAPCESVNGTTIDGEFPVMRVGKKRAGRLLDGVEHNGMPA